MSTPGAGGGEGRPPQQALAGRKPTPFQLSCPLSGAEKETQRRGGERRGQGEKMKGAGRAGGNEENFTARRLLPPPPLSDAAFEFKMGDQRRERFVLLPGGQMSPLSAPAPGPGPRAGQAACGAASRAQQPPHEPAGRPASTRLLGHREKDREVSSWLSSSTWNTEWGRKGGRRLAPRMSAEPILAGCVVRAAELFTGVEWLCPGTRMLCGVGRVLYAPGPDW